MFEEGAVFNGTIGMENLLLTLLGLDSGSGDNTLDFSAYTAGISVDLGINIPTTDIHLFAHAETADGRTIIPHFSNMQNVIGGSGDDRLWGNAEDNLLVGGAGDDELYGRDGQDILQGGTGDDLMNGGFDMAQIGLLDPVTLVSIFGDAVFEAIVNGTFDKALAGDQDTASYADTQAAVEVDLSLISAQETGGAGKDTLQGIQNLIGSDFDDTLRGNLWGNTLSGGAGNDKLYGMEGSDVLIGGAGSDLLDGGEYLSGPTLLEHDAASYADAESAVSVNLGLSGEQDTLAEGGDILAGIEELIGSDYDDILQGDQYDNILRGGKGGDLLEGGGGSDRLEGGEGSDTVTYANDSGDVLQGDYSIVADLDSGFAIDGSESTDILQGVENLTGSPLGDHLIGNSAGNLLDGGGGSDLLEGLAGSDSYRFVSNWSGVAIVENADSGSSNRAENEHSDVQDTLDFSSFNRNLTFKIHHDGTVSVEAAAGGLLISRIANVEKLLGGSGDNRFVFENGATFAGIIDGGEGSRNTLDYTAYGSGVNVNLKATDENSPGTATGTSGVLNIHKVVGTDLADTMIGDAGANILMGRGGHDTLSGADGDDVIYGGTGNDIIDGGAGNDTLYGDAGDDTLQGGTGDDLTTGGAGDDILAGEGGNDTALYDDVTDTRGVSVNLGLTTKQDTVGGGQDTLTDIENVTGSQYSDILSGNDQDNILTGGAGDDKLYGNKGNDILAGGLGDDQLYGGEGSNIVSYADLENQSNTGVSIDLSLRGADGRPTAQDTHGAGSDTLSEISHIIGSRYDDELTGDKFANMIFSGAGNDTMDGLGGDDTLSGGEGNDFISGGLGDDLLDGGAGGDKLYGEEGDDLLSGGFGNNLLDGGMGVNSASYLDAAAGVTVDLNSHEAQSTGGAGIDTLSNIANLFGSEFDDHLTGDGADNLLVGGGGDDTLIGGGGTDGLLGDTGDDLLQGGAGDDLLSGGDGRDRVSYVDDPGGVQVDLSTFSATDGYGNSDTPAEIEEVVGSAWDDVLIGDGADNLLVGGGGNDTLRGGEGDDTLAGGAGSDILEGGSGSDTASYAGDSTSVNVSLLAGTGRQGSDADALIGIENLTAGAGDDILTGDGGANVLKGGAGNDQLYGGPGDDLLEGGAGDDTISGGLGSDTASYAGDTAGVKVAIGGPAVDGSGAQDTLSDIENLTGSDYEDTLIGDGVANTLIGGAGNDVVSGGAGDDLLSGGAGNDLLDGGAGVDWGSYAEDTGGVEVFLNATAVDGYGDDDVLTDIENLAGSAYNDFLYGDRHDNMISGGAGDDVLLGGRGNDHLIGGEGRDTATYEHDPNGVTIVLAVSATDGCGNSDTLEEIENLIGSAGSDILTGDEQDNLIDGDAGDDTIHGGGGNDLLGGGLGNDILFGDTGDDVLEGGLGNDLLIGGEGSDAASYSGVEVAENDPDPQTGVTVSLGFVDVNGDPLAQNTVRAGSDTLTGIENLIGSLYDDTLTGDDQSNILIGGVGNDQLLGGHGDDTLYGGFGADTLDGGAGADTVSYRNDPDGVNVEVGDHATDGYGDSDTLIAVENLEGSEYDDVLIGDSADNRIEGRAGTDVLDGMGGNDTLEGGDGDDTLRGGGGTDTVSYADASAGVAVDLTTPRQQDTLGAGNDWLSGFENMTGSDYGDTLTGDGQANDLRGWRGRRFH